MSQLQPEQTAQTEEPASEEQSSAVLADNDDWGYHTTTEEFPAENIPAEPVDLPSEEIATDWGIEADTSSAETEDISKPIQNSPLSEDTVSPEETAAEPDTAVTDEAPAENADEGWEYVAVPEEETAAEPDTAVTTEAPAENADEGWEYAAVPEEESVAESADGNTAEGDWEWEYEEVSEDDGNTAETAQPANSSAAVPTGPDTESNEAQDWEWDYEEVSEDEGTSAADAGSAIQTQSEDEGWEYVEIPEDEAAPTKTGSMSRFRKKKPRPETATVSGNMLKFPRVKKHIRPTAAKEATGNGTMKKFPKMTAAQPNSRSKQKVRKQLRQTIPIAPKQLCKHRRKPKRPH